MKREKRFVDHVTATIEDWRGSIVDLALRLGRATRIAAVRRMAGDLHGRDIEVAVMIGFARWKRPIMRRCLPTATCVFLTGNPARLTREEAAVIDLFERPTVYVWSCRHPAFLETACAERGIDLVRVEDGFIRSVGLGLARTPPLSLVFDHRAMHFERDHASDLEGILARHDFDADPELMERAARLRERILSAELSKYNFADATTALDTVAPPDGRRRVLVIGQVEVDMSIRRGMRGQAGNLDLVRRAMVDEPDAQVLYRPHPDTVRTRRYGRPDFGDLPEGCIVLPPTVPLEACWKGVERVYTMTSLAGFEAALRGLEVVTLGMPFYAGWGFTIDRDPIERRTRHLTPLEVFAGAYLLYARYFDLDDGHAITAEAAVDRLVQDLAVARLRKKKNRRA